MKLKTPSKCWGKEGVAKDKRKEKANCLWVLIKKEKGMVNEAVFLLKGDICSISH